MAGVLGVHVVRVPRGDLRAALLAGQKPFEECSTVLYAATRRLAVHNGRRRYPLPKAETALAMVRYVLAGQSLAPRLSEGTFVQLWRDIPPRQ